MKQFLLIAFLVLNIFANELTVTIVYDDNRADTVVKTTYENGETALGILDRVATIETSKTGKYNFVRSINGKLSQKGKYGWFYLIDGQSVHKMASNYKLHDNKTMTWIYKVEDCYKAASCN